MGTMQQDISSKSSSSSSPKLILEKFKRIRQTKLTNAKSQQSLDKQITKKEPCQRAVKLHHNSSVSSSSPENSKKLSQKQILNKELFDRQCKELQKKFYESSDSNGFTPNTSDSLEILPQNERQFKFCKSEDDIDAVHTVGALHLKEPLLNQENEKIYYENRGRMEPINWSAILEEKNNVPQEKNTDILPSKNEEMHIVKEINEANPEFLNFVKNSTEFKTTYEVHNNIENNNSNSPMIKLLRKIKSKYPDILTVTADVKEAFKIPQLENHNINLIDPPIQSTNLKKFKESNIKQSENHVNKSQDLCEFDSKDTLSTLLIQNSNIKKKEKQRTFVEYDDEMFNFNKKSKKIVSQLSSEEFLPLEEETINKSINKGIVALSNSESPKPCDYLSFNKSENESGEEQLNYLLDSDDLLSEVNSEPNELKKSFTSNYETFKNKLKNASSQYSPIKSSNLKEIQFQENIKTKNQEIFLMKEIQTRNFVRSISSNTFEQEPNIVEISNVKIAPKEVVLKPLLTRYFPKSVKTEENTVDLKINEACSLNYNDKIMKNIETIDIVSTYNFEQTNLSDEKELKCNNDSDSSHDVYFSFECDDNIQNLTSNESDDNIIFYNCKSNESTKSSIVIQEIDSDLQHSADAVVSSSTLTINKSQALYEDVDSNEEFDIVNIDKFPLYSNLFNKLMEIREAQKAITGAKMNDLKVIEDAQIIVSNKSNFTESSLELSENQYSSIDASISSNIESDQNNAMNVFNPFLNEKNNIFADIKIDNNQLDNLVSNYYSNKSEPKKVVTLLNKVTETTNRMKKMKCALQKFQKDANLNNAQEIKIELEKPTDLESNANSNSNTIELPKRLQILQDLKKRKMQLTVKQRTTL